MSFLAGVMRQWVPISKYFTSTAVIDDSGQIVGNSTADVMAHLAKQWAPILSGVGSTFNQSYAEELLGERPRPEAWDWSKVQLPNSNTFAKIAKMAKDSATGFDGLPYSAHDTDLGTSAVLMEGMFSQMRSFDPTCPPPDVWF